MCAAGVFHLNAKLYQKIFLLKFLQNNFFFVLSLKSHQSFSFNLINTALNYSTLMSLFCSSC